MKMFVVEDEFTSGEKERCHEKSLIYIVTSTGMELKEGISLGYLQFHRHYQQKNSVDFLYWKTQDFDI